MNKVKRFFTNTIPNAFRNGVTLVRNNPMKSLAATVAVFIGGSSMVSAMSSKKYDKASDPSLDAQTSIVQDADETTAAYTSTTTTTTTTTGVTTGVSKTDSKETGTTVTTADETEFLSDYFKKYVEKVEFEDNNQPYIIDDENLLELNSPLISVDEEGFIVINTSSGSAAAGSVNQDGELELRGNVTINNNLLTNLEFVLILSIKSP